jgi:multidrug efflux pump subunit AcrB
MISQTAGSNAHEINQKIDQMAKELKSSLPNDLVISNLMDTNDFLNASISEVVKTLLETILLVILVVYIFLQSGRSTIIPSRVHHRVAHRHVRIHVSRRFQFKSAYALCSGACDRNGGR